MAALYTGFALMILTFVVIYTQWDLHLVTSDYYKQEIAYQEVIDKKANSKTLSGDVHFRWDETKQQVVIDFPEEISTAEVKVQVYRPSDSELDVNDELTASNGLAYVETGALKHGLWRVNIDWKAGGKDYFNEGVLIVQ